MHLQKITINKNTDYSGNTNDGITKRTNTSKTGYFAESSYWSVCLYTQYYAFVSVLQSIAKSFIGRKQKSSVLDIFYFFLNNAHKQ